jgi:hypothetical protein
MTNLTGQEMAQVLSKNISKTNVGGYAECYVDYTVDDFTYTFKIYSGTYSNRSNVVVAYTPLAQKLGLFDALERLTYTSASGLDPASRFSPYSSFRATTHELYNLFDGGGESEFIFDPSVPSIEGGRRDWYTSGQGTGKRSAGHDTADAGGLAVRVQYSLYNINSTIIDFNHPFNASGRITKLQGLISLDYYEDYPYYGRGGVYRVTSELYDCKFMIFRPKHDGFLELIHEVDIPDRSRSTGALYSNSQEVTSLDVDLFVQKGDLLGIYNASVFAGKTSVGEVDALYYQVDGKPTGEFYPGPLKGQGGRGVPLYGRSTETQRRLAIDIDLKRRYNISDITIDGYSDRQFLEYNLARCLDINWQVDLFGLKHTTTHKSPHVPGDFIYHRTNTYYGLNRLEDGIYDVPEGKACDSYYLVDDYRSPGVIDPAGPGVVPTNPYYFWINGDEEWLGTYLHATINHVDPKTSDFDEDPIAFTLYFPFQKNKKIYKSKIYFKERYNFRSFQLSSYKGSEYLFGDADDTHFDLIPKYDTVILDELIYTNDPEDPLYQSVYLYLFQNPTIGHAIL